ISQASKAYFGLKDFQQVKIIQKMSKDLNFPVKIIACPLIRQKDGLALSSRNIYLNAQEKNDALIINKTLKQAAQNFKIKSLDKVLEIAKDSLAKIPNSQIDYLEIRDFDDLSPANKKSKKAAMLIAIKIGKTRLIDNIIMEKK
ncbi:MAG: pantoate--beta-alanine ligase, partial [Elusimicrobiota bacterium]|nr:pantoate--beta-alanine ligase [Elusimicrobiota bacterium]